MTSDENSQPSNKVYLFREDGVGIAIASDGSILEWVTGSPIYHRQGLVHWLAMCAYEEHFNHEPFGVVNLLDVEDPHESPEFESAYNLNQQANTVLGPPNPESTPGV